MYKLEWEKAAKGNVSKWEMDSLSFYHNDHELAHLNKDKYGIKHQDIVGSLTIPTSIFSIIETLENNPLELGEIFKESDRVDKSQFSSKEWTQYRNAVERAIAQRIKGTPG